MVKLIYRISDGLIINRIELEDGDPYIPESGTAVADDVRGANIGDIYNPLDSSITPALIPAKTREDNLRDLVQDDTITHEQLVELLRLRGL